MSSLLERRFIISSLQTSEEMSHLGPERREQRLPSRYLSSRLKCRGAETVVKGCSLGSARTDSICLTQSRWYGAAPSPALGNAFKEVPFVAVNWAWITVPAVLLGLAFVFLLRTALRSARQGTKLWKDSSLAAFYHPLTGDGRQRLGVARDPRHVAKIAEDLNVRWAQTPRGWKFVKDGAAAC